LVWFPDKNPAIDYIIPENTTILANKNRGFTDNRNMILRVLHIPAGMVKISINGILAFNALEEIVVADGNKKYLGKDGVLFETGKGKLTLFYYPCAKPDTEYRVPDITTHIAPSAFTMLKYTKRIFIPKGVTLAPKTLDGLNGTIQSVCAHITSQELTKRKNSQLLFAIGFLENVSEYDEDERADFTAFCKSNSRRLRDLIIYFESIAALVGFAETVGLDVKTYEAFLEDAQKAKKDQIVAFLLDYRKKNLSDEVFKKAEKKNLDKAMETAARKKAKGNEVLAEFGEMTINGLKQISETGEHYVKVIFSDGRSFKYACPFKVKVGDRVKVSGSRRGQIGAVTEIDANDNWYDERGGYMQEIVEAYSVSDIV